MGERAYGGVPAADRRLARRARLVEAVLDVVGRDGLAGVTVTGVCRAARLNERYFYESFSDRTEAVLAAAEHVAATVAAQVTERLAGAPDAPRPAARAAIGAAVDVLAEDPRMAALFLEASFSPEIAGRRSGFAATFVALMAEQAVRHLRLEPTPEVRSWGTFTATHLLGGVLETIGAWLRGELAVTREELVDRNVDLFLAVGAAAPSGAATPTGGS